MCTSEWALGVLGIGGSGRAVVGVVAMLSSGGSSHLSRECALRLSLELRRCARWL